MKADVLTSKVLESLGWDMFAEGLSHERVLTGGAKHHTVAYWLRSGDREVAVDTDKTAFRNSDRLATKFKQVCQDGALFYVLTNGHRWRFYLSASIVLLPEDDNFLDFSVLTLDSGQLREMVEHMVELLSNDTAGSWQESQVYASVLLESKQFDERLETALPEALIDLLREPSDLFLDLLVGKTNLRLGDTMHPKTIEKKLPALIERLQQPVSDHASQQRSHKRASAKPRARRKKTSAPAAFTLFTEHHRIGPNHQIKSQKAGLRFVVEQLYARHPDRFDMILDCGRPDSRWKYASRDINKIMRATKNAQPIANTGIYITEVLSAKDCWKRARVFLERFGYSETDLVLHS